jgi:hypothetical protein
MISIFGIKSAHGTVMKEGISRMGTMVLGYQCPAIHGNLGQLGQNRDTEFRCLYNQDFLVTMMMILSCHILRRPDN